MPRWERGISPALLTAGAALIAYAVATGQARFYLVLVIPVVTGDSIALVLGAVFLVVGFLLIPWSFPGVAEEAPDGRPVRGGVAASSEPTTGGLLLVGPVPFFFGRWRSHSRTRYWLALGLGLALIVAFAALWLVG
jgi:uncharacterized membrane protein